MPKILNRNKIIKMKKLGFTNKEISARLHCSEKQVGRIVKSLSQVDPISEAPIASTDSEKENMLRQFFNRFESSGKTAERFGVSRQAIFQSLLLQED